MDINKHKKNRIPSFVSLDIRVEYWNYTEKNKKRPDTAEVTPKS